MKTILIIIILCLIPVSAHCLTDQEAFVLLSQKSKEITTFPFHVYVKREHSKALPNYGPFQGVQLPDSAYSFYARIYGIQKSDQQTDNLFATYMFSQGTRWKCFILRVPSMYANEAIDLWVYDTEQREWQKTLRIAELWGDAGDAFNMQSWIEDLNQDSNLDIIKRTITMESNMDATNLREQKTRKTNVLIWDKDRFRDESRLYLPTLDLKKYKINETKYK